MFACVLYLRLVAITLLCEYCHNNTLVNVPTRRAMTTTCYALHTHFVRVEFLCWFFFRLLFSSASTSLSHTVHGTCMCMLRRECASVCECKRVNVYTLHSAHRNSDIVHFSLYCGKPDVLQMHAYCVYDRNVNVFVLSSLFCFTYFMHRRRQDLHYAFSLALFIPIEQKK